MRVLSKSPDRRPQSAEAMMSELWRAREQPAVSSGVRSSLGLDPVRERSRPSMPLHVNLSDRESTGADLRYERPRRWSATNALRRHAIVAWVLLGVALTSAGIVAFRLHATPFSSRRLATWSLRWSRPLRRPSTPLPWLRHRMRSPLLRKHNPRLSRSLHLPSDSRADARVPPAPALPLPSPRETLRLATDIWSDSAPFSRRHAQLRLMGKTIKC